jgi:glycosyltransferase involved in cell wall biosynthesis
MAGPTDPALQLAPRKCVGGPRVSIIMPAFRRSHQIPESIRSLLDGGYQDFELLVRDDGNGSDGTEQAVAHAAAGDSRVRYHRNSANLGVARNLNAGIRASQGELIAVCHDHDLYRPGFLRAMVNALDRHPSVLYVHCASQVIGQGGERKGSNVSSFAELTTGTEWLKFMLSTPHCPVCALTLVRRSAHERYGLYNPGYGFVTDIDMWMRLSVYGDVAYVREPYLLLRERERDHHANSNFAGITRTVARIHSHYLPVAYHGAERVRATLRLHIWRNRIMLTGAAQTFKRRVMQADVQRMRIEGA